MPALLRPGAAARAGRFLLIAAFAASLGWSATALAGGPAPVRAGARAHPAGARRVPQGFLGVMVDGALIHQTTPQSTIDREFALMSTNGVESVRIGVYWSDIQPYANDAAVPPGQAGHFSDVDGIPSDFSGTDRLFAAAAERHLSVLPVVLRAPPWARRDPALPYSPPADPSTYGRFVGELVRRYGPGGSFWSAHPQVPDLPVHAWQIWNEPSGGVSPEGRSVFWQDPQPFQDRYIAMLRAARAQIRAVDPAGQVIMAGLFGRAWVALSSLYAHGARGLFDGVALNIFTKQPVNVAVALDYTRTVMNRHGDRAVPLYVTEFSWPSAVGHIQARYAYGYEVTQAQEGQRLSTAVALMVARRVRLNLRGIFWYTWLSPDAADAPFDYAGLRHVSASGVVTPKPAQAAFRRVARALEGCAKSALADVCA